MIYIDNIFNNYSKIKEIFETPELHISKDETANYVKYPIRILRDETTSNFTKFFLSNEKKRKDFISYTFHTINTHIQLNINNLLIDNGNEFLSSSEAVYLVFKGGNVMNYYFTKVINPDVDNTNYKISDVDYSIYIKTYNKSRFNIIKKAVYTLLIEALTKISNKFNELYKTKKEHLIEEEIFEYIDNKTITSLIEGLKIYSNINDTNYKTFINDILKKCIGETGYQELTGKQYIYELLKETISLNSTKYLIDLLDIYNIFNKCLYYYENKEQIISDSDNILKYLKKIKEILYKLINNFVDNELSKKINNFYNIKIDDFFKNVCSDVIKKINELPVNNERRELPVNNERRELYEVLDGNLITYTFPKDIIEVECISEPTSHKFITCKEPNKTNILASNNKYQHYISYNSIIYPETINKPIENKIKFDLARIKFNVELNIDYTKKTTLDNLPNYTSDYASICEDTVMDKLNIPSEFIDVSIPDFIDGSREHYMYSLSKEPHRLVDNKNDLHVYSYSVLQIAEDLENVLFVQNIQILPWLDNKYEKRLDRLVLFLLLSYYSNEYTKSKKDNYDFILRIYDLCEYIIESSDKDIIELCDGTFDEYNFNYHNLSLPYNKDNYINPTINDEYKLNIYGKEIFISLVKHYNMFKSINKPSKIIIDNYNMLRWRLIKYPNSTEDEINNSYNTIISQKEQFIKFVNNLKNIIDKYIGTELIKKGKKTVILNEDNINKKIKTIINDLLKYGFAIQTTSEGEYSIVISNKYKNKYIKYKNKYLILKKELNIN